MALTFTYHWHVISHDACSAPKARNVKVWASEPVSKLKVLKDLIESAKRTFENGSAVHCWEKNANLNKKPVKRATEIVFTVFPRFE